MSPSLGAKRLPESPVRVCVQDVDGDGNDEIVLGTGWLVLRASTPLEPVVLEPSRNGQLIGWLPAGSDRLTAVVAQPNEMLGVEPVSNRILWSGRTEGLTLSHEFLVDVDVPERVPTLVLADDHEIVLRAMTPHASAERAVVGLARQPARLHPDEPDPRLRQRLPWADGCLGYAPFFGYRSDTHLATWGLLWAATLLVAPAAYLRHLVRRRRWTLREFLVIPVLAAVAVSVAKWPGPHDETLVDKLHFAVFVAPLAILAAGVCAAFRARRVAWLASWLVIVAGTAAGLAWRELAFVEKPLEFDQYYVADGWYRTLGWALAYVAWLHLAWWPLPRLVLWARGRLRKWSRAN